MEQYDDSLSTVFLALADPTRRAVIAQLSLGPASVSELALPFAMTLPSFMKHIHSLEGGGLIRTRKLGRTRTCELDRRCFGMVESWLHQQRMLWEAHADRLDHFVTQAYGKETPE